jgi:hypothetical protein
MQERRSKPGVGIAMRIVRTAPWATWPPASSRCWARATRPNPSRLLSFRLDLSWGEGHSCTDSHSGWDIVFRKVKQAQKGFDLLVASYEAKYHKAVECLVQGRATLLTLYDFTAKHWIHLRTTNPIESQFATVRLRQSRTKGNGSRQACLAMVFKLAESAQN